MCYMIHRYVEYSLEQELFVVLTGNGKIKMEETGEEGKLQRYKIGMNLY